MPRYKLTIEYDGRSFIGWQRQNNGLSVQAVLERAGHAFCGKKVSMFAAGRTDSGVHALAQTAHVEFPLLIPAHTVRNALNFHMKQYPVVILDAQEVTDDFHARFSCLGRVYLYRILNRRAPPALDTGRIWWISTPLDEKIMRMAAEKLIGKHDFSTFRATACQANSPIKTLDKLDIVRIGEEIQIIAEARSFLHHQVRNLVGTLRLVGEKKWTITDLQNALKARTRKAGGPTAPSNGLYFVRAIY